MTTKHDFLKLADLSLMEAREVLSLSARMKREPKGQRTQLLAGRAVAIVLDAPPGMELDRWGPVPGPALGLMRRVKQRFDPAGTCNPGVFVGGI